MNIRITRIYNRTFAKKRPSFRTGDSDSFFWNLYLDVQFRPQILFQFSSLQPLMLDSIINSDQIAVGAPTYFSRLLMTHR